jgi:hypothetical protein
MKKKYVYILIAMFLFCAAFIACSSGKDAETEKGVIDKMTDRAAKGMTDSIQIPLQRARAAAKLEEDKLRELDVAMKDK